MKAKKPNWTPLELREKYYRWETLLHETDSHIEDCDCRLCMECFGLGELMDCFTQDEHAEAVNAGLVAEISAGNFLDGFTETSSTGKTIDLVKLVSDEEN